MQHTGLGHEPTHRILGGLLADIESFVLVQEAALRSPPEYVERMLWDGVPYDPAHWLGRDLTPAERMAFTSAHRRLARDGLVVGVYAFKRDRLRCLRPTLRGLRLALGLAGPAADRATVVAGLRRTMWGGPLADALVTRRLALV